MLFRQVPLLLRSSAETNANWQCARRLSGRSLSCPGLGHAPLRRTAAPKSGREPGPMPRSGYAYPWHVAGAGSPSAAGLCGRWWASPGFRRGVLHLWGLLVLPAIPSRGGPPLGPPTCTRAVQDKVTRCLPPWRQLSVQHIAWGVKAQTAPTLSSISRLP